MAEFLITAPDGKKYKVTGATKEGALAALKAKLGQSSAQQPQGPQYDSFGDLVKQRGQQAAQGATEVFASVPEALAIAGAGNPNAGANVVAENVQKAQADLAALDKDYAERVAAYKDASREPPEELVQRYKDQRRELTQTIDGIVVRGSGQGAWTQSNRQYLDTVTKGGQVNLKPDAQDRELFKAGDALRQKSEDVFGKPQEGDTSFWGQVAQGVGNVAGMAVTGPLAIPAGASMNSSQLYKEAKASGASEEDAKRAAELGAWVGTTEIIPINRALKLLPPRLREKVGGGLWKRFTDIAQSAGEEAAQEYLQTVANNLIAQNIYDPERGWNEGASEAALVGAFVGGTVGTVGVALNNSLYKEDGTIADPDTVDGMSAEAAADVARMIRQEAADNGYNLKKVGASDESGSKKALEAVHEKISGRLTALAKDPSVRQLLSPKQAKSLDQLLDDYAAAQTAIRQGKNKVKSKVTQENFDAIKRLLGPTKEGAEILNLLRQSNVVTDLFNNGLKGGLSQFTDYLNPFATSGGAYDPSRTMNVLTGGTSALTLGPLATAGIVAGGRAVDAVTGRRSVIDRFVRKNEGKRGLGQAEGRSLIEERAQEALDAQLREQEDQNRAAALGALPQSDKDNSPIGSILLGTGVDRDGLRTAMDEIEAVYQDDAVALKALQDVFTDIRKNLDGGTNKIRNLNDVIPIINSHLNTPDTQVQRAARPDQMLAQRGNVNMPTFDQTPPSQPDVMSQAPSFGAQATTQENYDRGVQSNRNAAELLNLQAQGDTNLNVGEKAQIGQALTMLQENLGSNPVAAAQGIMEGLQGKVSQEAIDTYVKPYVDRVMQQQASRQFMPTGEGPRGLAAAQAAGVAPTVDTQAPTQPEVQTDAPANLGDMNDIVRPIPPRPALAPQEDEPQPIPRGETTNIQMPNELGAVFEFAKNSNFAKGRDLKVALQEKSLAAQKEEGIDLSKLSEENVNRLADHVVADALVALQDNSNAIGWYDRTVTDALNTLGEIYPEIQTNPVNKLQFIWALAVTSNGTKVDKNFELAATAYDHLQRTGRFPTDIGIGEAARAINGGLEMYHTMMDKFDRKTNSSEGDHQLLADFMNSQVPVKEIEKDYDVKISGEGKNTLVRGASILGPKIGNGFFSNLYGNFDALTMDRWLMRSVGRMRGTLIKINQPMINQKNSEIKSLISDADATTLKSLRSYLKPSGIKIGKSMSKQDVNDLAAYIAKQSTSKEWRTGLNGISEDLRKAGNALAKYLDGQVEAPAGAKERDFIRAVFKQALDRLNSDPAITRVSNTGLTMSDLQALLWYPEKRLYDTAKAKEGEESKGYADDEAPDYANAARKLVQARSEMAGRGGLGPIGTNGPGGGGASNPNARPALAPIQDNVAGVLAQRIAGGSPRRAPVPSTQEVKQAAEPVRQALSVGLPGGEFENGIKDINQVYKLADAIGVVLKMTDDQGLISKISGSPTALGLYDPNTQDAYALNPGQIGLQNISEFQSYIIALHEVAHGIADMSGDNFHGVYGSYNKGDGTSYVNPMTGNADLARQNSFDDMVARMLIMYKQGLHQSTGRQAQAERKQIITEMRKLQDKGKYDNGSDVRYTGGAKTRDIERRDTPYYKYIRNAQEFAVDPLIFYMHSPKRMKEEFPATAKMISNFFKNSGKINFYSHPLAMAIAVILASMMKADQEDEREKQQAAMMPPGALNQPMAPGMLSAQQA